MELEKAGESGRFGKSRRNYTKGRNYVKLLKEIATLFV